MILLGWQVKYWLLVGSVSIGLIVSPPTGAPPGIWKIIGIDLPPFGTLIMFVAGFGRGI